MWVCDNSHQWMVSGYCVIMGLRPYMVQMCEPVISSRPVQAHGSTALSRHFFFASLEGCNLQSHNRLGRYVIEIEIRQLKAVQGFPVRHTYTCTLVCNELSMHMAHSPPTHFSGCSYSSMSVLISQVKRAALVESNVTSCHHW
jgi:hypothetical protein